MNESQEKVEYYSIIPAKILYNKNLNKIIKNLNEKLIKNKQTKNYLPTG